MTRQKRVEGDIVRIDLKDGTHAYGWISRDPLIVLLAGTFSRDVSTEEIGSLPVAFKVWVHNDAIKKGIWPVIGHIELPDRLREEPYFCKQDPISGRLYLHHSRFASTGYEHAASLEDCQGLESAAVWEPEHVVDRLRDLRDGRENIWAQMLRVDPNKVPHD